MVNPIASLKKFIGDARRIMSISYKPTTEHFVKTLKIVLLGTLLVGFLGYIISLIIGFIA